MVYSIYIVVKRLILELGRLRSQILPLLLSGGVTLGRLLNFSETQFLQLWNRSNKYIPNGTLEGLN